MWEVLLFAFFLFFPAPPYRGAGVTLFRNRGTEVLLVPDGSLWGFPANRTDAWDSSWQETATRALYAHTGWEDGRDYTLCSSNEFRLGSYAYYTAHLSRFARARSGAFRWVPVESVKKESINDHVKLWSGVKTCHIL